MTIAATSGSAYWFITRGTGVVALILLTLTTALGLANASRLRGRYLPRFVVDAIHRNAALLAVSFLVVHVVTFTSPPRPGVSMTVFGGFAG